MADAAPPDHSLGEFFRATELLRLAQPFKFKRLKYSFNWHSQALPSALLKLENVQVVSAAHIAIVSAADFGDQFVWLESPE